MENYGITFIMLFSAAYVMSVLFETKPHIAEIMGRYRLNRWHLCALLFCALFVIDGVFRQSIGAYPVWMHLRNMFGGLGMGWVMMRVMQGNV